MTVTSPSPQCWHYSMLQLQELIPTANIFSSEQVERIKQSLDQMVSDCSKIIVNSFNDLPHAKKQIRQVVYRARDLYNQYLQQSAELATINEKAYHIAFNKFLLFLKTNGFFASNSYRPMIACYLSTKYEAQTLTLIQKLLDQGYRVCVPIVVDTNTSYDQLNHKLSKLFELLPMVWCEINHVDLSDETAFTTNHWNIYEPSIRQAVQTCLQKTTLTEIEHCRLAFNSGAPLVLEQNLANEFASVIPISDIDVYLTPATLLSHTKQRVGMGGGYYDRNFARHQLFAQYHDDVKYKVIGYVYDWQVVADIPYMTALDFNVDNFITVDTQINQILQP